MKQIDIKKEFQKRKKRQVIIAVSIIPIFVLLLYVKSFPDSIIFELVDYKQVVLISGLMIGLTLISSYLNWRCPSCEKYIGRSLNPNHRHCSNCGAELR